jgi:hypothetical protein
MRKALALILLGLGVLATASAVSVVEAPEIDAASGVNALALLAGAVLLVKGRRRK